MTKLKKMKMEVHTISNIKEDLGPDNKKGKIILARNYRKLILTQKRKPNKLKTIWNNNNNTNKNKNKASCRYKTIDNI